MSEWSVWECGHGRLEGCGLHRPMAELVRSILLTSVTHVPHKASIPGACGHADAEREMTSKTLVLTAGSWSYLQGTTTTQSPLSSRLCLLLLLFLLCLFVAARLLLLDTRGSCPTEPQPAHLRFPGTRRRLPGCVIIGARKCGTRALLEFLDAHPQVRKAADETHFFDERYHLGLEWYRRQMPYSFPGQVTLEKTPAYFVTPVAPARLRSMNDSLKLLLIVRDPVTRLVSDYAQQAANKARRVHTPPPAFERLVLRPDGSVDVTFKAVRIGLYAQHLVPWIQAFPRRQLHIVDGERLVRDPYAEVRLVEDFLGIGHKVARDAFVFNQTKGFFCLRNATSEKCLNESKGRRHPRVDPEVVSILRRFYAPYNKAFYRAIGRDFGWPEE